MTLFFLLNPKHYSNDNADVFRRRVRAYKKRVEKEEDNIAAQILLQRLLQSEDIEAEVKEEIVDLIAKEPAINIERIFQRLKQIIPLILNLGEFSKLTIPLAYLTKLDDKKPSVQISDKLLKTIIVYTVLDEL